MTLYSPRRVPTLADRALKLFPPTRPLWARDRTICIIDDNRDGATRPTPTGRLHDERVNRPARLRPRQSRPKRARGAGTGAGPGVPSRPEAPPSTTEHGFWGGALFVPCSLRAGHDHIRTALPHRGRSARVEQMLWVTTPTSWPPPS